MTDAKAAEHACGEYAEPHAHAHDSKEHPLFSACLREAEIHGESSGTADLLIFAGRPLNVTSSCLIMLTTAGRIIAQRHRCGYQGFGGGSHRMPMVWSIHQARREAWMEGNFDVSNSAVVRLSNLILVTQPRDSWWKFWSCLVQFVLLRDEQVVVDEQGIVTVGGVPMFSREQARDRNRYPELVPKPTVEHIRAGQFYLNVPIMHVMQLSSVFASPQEWRGCDWITIVMCRDLIEAFISGQVPPSTAKYFGCVPTEYAQDCTSFLDWWDQRLAEVGRATWPLLETSRLYNEWAYEASRRSCFIEYIAAKQLSVAT